MISTENDNLWKWQLLRLTITENDNYWIWQLVKMKIFGNDNYWERKFVKMTITGNVNYWNWQVLRMTITENDNLWKWQLLGMTITEGDNYWGWQLQKMTSNENDNYWKGQCLRMTIRESDNYWEWQFVKMTITENDNLWKWQLLKITITANKNLWKWQSLGMTITQNDLKEPRDPKPLTIPRARTLILGHWRGRNVSVTTDTKQRLVIPTIYCTQQHRSIPDQHPIHQLRPLTPIQLQGAHHRPLLLLQHRQASSTPLPPSSTGHKLSPFLCLTYTPTYTMLELLCDDIWHFSHTLSRSFDHHACDGSQLRLHFFHYFTYPSPLAESKSLSFLPLWR
jgi:hypothetical protein